MSRPFETILIVSSFLSGHFLVNIHEYQAKALLADYGVQILRGGVAHNLAEVGPVAEQLGGPVWVVKAQIHAGGRGKAGGVRSVDSVEAACAAAAEMFGKKLVTPQTGPQGKEVRRIYIEDGCAIAREFYLGMLIDRESSQVAILASAEGGMDIEEVARTAPEKILKVMIDPAVGYQPYHGRRIADGLGLNAVAGAGLIASLRAMSQAFQELDCSQIEINPLVLTTEDAVIALDAKINFDDNALFRQKNITQLRDQDEEDPTEFEAATHDLNYVKLDGTIGCMVNGAGLAMATMDIIQLAGGEPANFLDVGGGATKERVEIAFKIILADPKVEAVLVNIFGGIMRCDAIAEGIVAAARGTSLKVPLVVRLEGTNMELGKDILTKSGLNIIPAEGMEEAAEKAIAATRGQV